MSGVVMPTDEVGSTVHPGKLRLDHSAEPKHHSTPPESEPEWKSLVSSVAQSCVSGASVSGASVSSASVSGDTVDELVEQLAQAVSQKVIEQQQQKMAALIHDLRHPLAAIRGVADLVLTDSLSEPQRERIGIIKTTCDGLLDLMAQTLEAGSPSGAAPASEPDSKAVDVDQLIHETLREAAYASQQRQLDLFYYRPKNVSRWAQLDVVAMKQVLGNLISNAVKFTQAGSVSVQVNQVRVDDQKHLHLVVEDTGPGIPRDMHDAIFHPYAQVDGADSRGVGLGLAICRQLVEQLNGQLWAESRLGCGSRFHLTVPFVSDIPIEHQSTQMLTGDLVGHRALLVSANSRQAQIFRHVLNDAGVRVSFARPQDFRAILEAGSMELLDFDSLIIDADQTMGDLVSLLRKQANVNCVIVWLAMIGQGFTADSKFDYVLTKPVFYDELAIALATGRVIADEATTRDSENRMLIVDDSEINRMISAGVFDAEGHEVDLLADGSEVVAAVEKHRYDLILLDIEMPGMDGFETAAAVRRFELAQGCERIPIVAMTAHDTNLIAERAAQNGIDVCLRKPLDSAVLWNGLEELRTKEIARPAARLNANTDDGSETGPRIKTMQLHPLKKIRQ